MTDLKPCPFCGSEEICVDRDGTNNRLCIVRCTYCGWKLESSEIDVGEAWNKLAEQKEFTQNK